MTQRPASSLAARRSALTLAALASVLFCQAHLARGEIIDRLMAVVAGKVITWSDARAALAFGLVETTGAADPTAAAVEQLIERALVLAEVDRYAPPEPAASAVAAGLEAVHKRFPSAATWQAALATYGVVEQRLRETIREDLRIQAYLDERFAAAAQPSPEETARYYRDHQAEFTKEGAPLPFREARAIVRERLERERRRTLIADWISGLRRRADVIQLYLPQQ